MYGYVDSVPIYLTSAEQLADVYFKVDILKFILT